MDDYTKKFEDLIHEIKRLRSSNDTLTDELRNARKEILTQTTLISQLKLSTQTQILSNRTLKQENTILKKTILTKEKTYENKIRRMNFYEDRRTSKNKLEKVLRIENTLLKNKNKILEDCMHKFGTLIEFDSYQMCEIMDYMKNVNEECITKLMNNVVKRNNKSNII